MTQPAQRDLSKMTPMQLMTLGLEEADRARNTPPAPPAPEQQRASFIATKLGSLPGVYSDQLGTDPAMWEAQAAGISQQFNDDLEKYAEPVKPDLSKMTPTQLLTMGLEQSSMAQKPTARPVPPTPAPAPSTPALATPAPAPSQQPRAMSALDHATQQREQARRDAMSPWDLISAGLAGRPI